MKKRITIIFCLVLLAALLPLTMHRASAEEASGQCGDDLYWTFDESTGTLTITGSGDMYSYSETTMPWEAYRTQMKAVIFPEELKSIGDNAFSGCTGLTSITIPDSVTSIGDSAFSGCTGLTEITIPDSVTSIDNAAFFGCTGLTSVTIGNGVTSIGSYAFYDCTGLTEITIPDSVTSIGAALFSGCTGLTEINVDTGNVNYRSIDGVLFYSGMWGLYAYPAGNPRTSYTIPEGVTSIESNAFEGCKYLTSVTFPNSLTDINDFAFAGCYCLTELSLPDNVERIGSWAFNSTGWWYAQPDGPVYLDYFLLGVKSSCPENLVVRDGTRRISDSAFSYGYGIPGCLEIVSLTIPDSVESIGPRAFSGCENLSAITIGSGIRSISNNSFEGTAWWNAQEDGVVYLDYILIGAKNSCPNTVTLKDGTLVIARNATKGSLWYNVELIIPDSITELQSNFMDGSFQKVVIGDGLTEIGSSMFRRCGRLKSVTIGKCVTEIGGYAFLSCSSLSEIVCPDQVMYIRFSAFRNCAALKNVSIGSGMRTIETGAFDLCSALSDVYYNGTETERNERIQISRGNQNLQYATWHYQSHALDGTIEWNSEDVKFKGTTPYVIANGTAQTPRFVVKNAADGSVIDPANYDFEYRENTKAGTGYVIVTFKGDYEGMCRGSFKIYLPPTTTTTVENVGDGIKLTWSKVDGADGYVIYRRAWSSTTDGWTDFVRWNNTTALKWTDTKVYAGTRYQYGIKAYFNKRLDPVTNTYIGGNVGDNFNLGVVGPLKTTVRITTRTLKSVTPGTKQLTVKWGASSQFTGYQIQYATNSAFTQNVKAIKIANPKTASTVIKSLTSGKTYYVRVRSYHEFNGMTYFGEWSNVLSGKVK